MTTLVAIRSATFPGRYIRLDGTGVTSFTGSGGGKVNTQTYIGTLETFILQHNDDGTVSFKSTAYDNVFIRMNVGDVAAGKKVEGGGGVVNGQFTARSLEKFKIVKKASEPGKYQGVVNIESAASAGRFLRLDGNAGVVNAQGVNRSYEEFEILVVG